MFTTRLQENIGRILHSRYTLVAAIGQGASGDVYLAQDLSLGRKVAIKLLHSSLAGDPFFLKRFQSEAKSAASLNHPHIMRVFDWGEDGSTPYLVLEYLSGGSLREYLNPGVLLDQAQAVSLMLQVAQGLSYAHGRGYVHRDIKPANLLFDDEARIRIADFGLARALSEAAWTEPVGRLMGTARYASPEQAMAKESDRSSDVYSLGLVVHEALLGYLPFKGDTTVALLMARTHHDVSVPETAGPLKPILESCLKVSSLERSSSTELVGKLEKLVRVLDPPAPLVVKGPSPMVTDENGDLTDIPEAQLLSSGISRSNGSQIPTALIPVVAPPLESTSIRTSNEFQKTAFSGDGGRESDGYIDEGSDNANWYKKRRFWVFSAIALVVLLIGSLFLTKIPSNVFASVFSTKVPLVVGDSMSAATSAIDSAHLKVGLVTKAYSPTVKSGIVSAESPRNGTSLPRGKSVNLVISKGPAPVKIPKLAGLSLSNAESLLKSIRLVPVAVKSYSETVPVGIVISASPASGIVDVDTKITLTESQGPAPRKVPNLVGETSADATTQLKALSLVPSESKSYSNTIPAGQIMSQNPPADTMVPRGATIAYVVSKGPQIVTVPNVQGATLQQAEAMLNQVGLTVGSVYSYFGSNTVVASSPRAGSQVRAGTSVDLVTG